MGPETPCTTYHLGSEEIDLCFPYNEQPDLGGCHLGLDKGGRPAHVEGQATTHDTAKRLQTLGGREGMDSPELSEQRGTVAPRGTPEQFGGAVRHLQHKRGRRIIRAVCRQDIKRPKIVHATWVVFFRPRKGERAGSHRSRQLGTLQPKPSLFGRTHSKAVGSTSQG